VAAVEAELVGELTEESLVALEVRALRVVVEATSKLVWRPLTVTELPLAEADDSVAL
jgi:hypothetical protein